MKYYSEIINDKGTVAVDDTILVKGHLATCGSHILEGYKPLFSAEAVERLEKSGYEISGKCHVGEFGLDLAGEFSYYAASEDGDSQDAKSDAKSGEIKGAAAEAVAHGEVKYALGVDMNGATRRAAALSGIDFLKPTYGTVSRYGIISCAASGEQMGVYASDIEGIKEIMSVIAGHDEKDGTSLRNEKYTYSTDEDIKDKKVCIVKELMDKAEPEVKALVKEYAEKLEAQGVEVEEVSFDVMDVANTAWQILMTAETCNNVSRYDGVKFGFRAEKYKNIDELYVNSRTEGLNFLTKAVILYGSDVLSKNRYDECYGKSLKVRRVIAEKWAELMKKYDACLAPCMSKMAWQKYDIKDAFELVFKESVFTAVPNLIGTPAIVSKGVELMGAHFSESLLMSLASAVERGCK